MNHNSNGSGADSPVGSRDSRPISPIHPHAAVASVNARVQAAPKNKMETAFVAGRTSMNADVDDAIQSTIHDAVNEAWWMPVYMVKLGRQPVTIEFIKVSVRQALTTAMATAIIAAAVRTSANATEDDAIQSTIKEALKTAIYYSCSEFCHRQSAPLNTAVKPASNFEAAVRAAVPPAAQQAANKTVETAGVEAAADQNSARGEPINAESGADIAMHDNSDSPLYEETAHAYFFIRQDMFRSQLSFFHTGIGEANCGKFREQMALHATIVFHIGGT
ncbi:hypothetical protein RUND412_005021 [Rhizina undulata]